MHEPQSFEFTTPEMLHLRPLGLIIKFAKRAEYNNKWVTLSLSNGVEKLSASKNILALALLWIQKNTTVLLEIDWGTPEQVEEIIKSFKDNVLSKLGDSHLHAPRQEIIASSWIDIRKGGERHPEYDKFQERYDFLGSRQGNL